MPLEHLVLDRVELVADLVEDREAVVEEVVEHLVEQPARALREQLLAELLVGLATREEARHGEELAVRDRDEVVGPDEDVELGGVQPLNRLVVDGEVEDDEEVAVVLVVVDLRTLALRDDVLDVERMPAEALRQARWPISRSGPTTLTQVSPLASSSANRRGACDDLRCSAAAGPACDPGQARHRY